MATVQNDAQKEIQKIIAELKPPGSCALCGTDLGENAMLRVETYGKGTRIGRICEACSEVPAEKGRL